MAIIILLLNPLMIINHVYCIMNISADCLYYFWEGC